MKTCPECHYVDRQGSKNPHVWTCSLFPRDEIDPVTGGGEPSSWPCYLVTRTSCPNKTSPCTFFKPLPNVGEAVVKEGRGEKSVTFKDKETVK